MPSLFNRRSRSVSTSRPVTPASSSAHVAAAQAFLANRQSQTNLSTSAAAAALRSMSPAPTPIEQIQTKRMLNRQASNASMGTATRGRSRPTMQRRPSSGSMTERTFRSPSPGRSASSQGKAAVYAPPVPPVPDTFRTEDVPPIPKKSHRRSMSLENFTSRVASPPPVRGPAATNTLHRNVSASNMAALAATRSASLRQNDNLERSDSRNSYNFSYPRGSRPNSPPPQPMRASSSATAKQSPSANGLSAMETRTIQNSLSHIAAEPVKKKKKKIVPDSGEGRHLQNGSMTDPTAAAGRPAPHEVGPGQTRQQDTKKKARAAVLSGENTHFPDRNPETIESDQERERRANRAAGVLTKQPSVVKEDWDGEQDNIRPSIETPSSPIASGPSSTISSKPAKKVQSKKPTTAANMSRKIEDTSRSSVHAAVTTPPPPQTKKNLAPNAGDGVNGRQSSISPSRSFRFSERIASDLTAGRKHEPLPRSVSPAKSALKHHSPSRSDTSPTDGHFPERRGSSVAPSEASEASVDIVARKKANRVSFEASPDVVAAATGQDSTPQGSKEGGKRSWFGKSKKPSPLSKATTDDDDEGMKPRPVLPSFGSVRKNRSDDTSPSPAARKPNDAAASTGSLSEASSLGDPHTGNAISNNDTIGGGVHERSGISTRPHSDVTSTDGTGYASDSDELSSDEDDINIVKPQINLPRDAQQTKVDTGTGVVPAIAIQPATPGLDATEQKTEWVESAPANMTTPVDSASEKVTRPESNANTSQPIAAHDIGSGDIEDESTALDSPADEHRLNTIKEESDDDSVYDEAPEDSSEVEGLGYGSINAIVQSPVVNSSPPVGGRAVPASPTDLGTGNENADGDVSWKESQAYWSGISKQVRNTAMVSTSDSGTPSKPSLQPAAEIVSKPTSRTKTGTATSTATAGNTTRLDGAMSTGQSASRKTSHNTFRHSMREDPAQSPTLRPRPQSMISPPRPSSMVQSAASGKKSQPALAKPASSKLQRALSNDSDSDSSFKRARPKRPAGSGFARRSMRDTAPATDQNAGRPSRDARAMSPVDRQPLAPPRMRASMRGSQGPAGPTLRNRTEEKRSSSLFGKARKAKSPSRSMSALGSKSGSQSRFADSDDEDQVFPSTYQSRYVDSSDDDDEPEPLRPVRGIPKRNDEGDSTDLEDSSDDQRRKAKPSTPRTKLEVKIPPLSSPTASEPMSPATAKKKGFWGRLRGGKKDKEPNAQFMITERNRASALTNNNSSAQVADSNEDDARNAAQLGFSSTAERDALVEQMVRKLEAAQSQGSPAQAASSKRMTPQRVLSDSWPLPPKLNGIPEDRPVTSAGAGEPLRPGMGERLPTSETLRTTGGTVVYGRSGKKKKFPRLRRAFGLTD